MKALWISLTLILTACASTAKAPYSAPSAPTPSAPAPQTFTAAWDSRPNAALWTGYLDQALRTDGAALLAAVPSDIALFCGPYASLTPRDREQVWITLISAMARRESNFDPAQRYDEPGLDEDSIGLLQLSLGDAQRYGCAFATEADITDPQRNLACGVKIMTRLVTRAGFIGGDDANPRTGAAAYWSTLRSRPQNIASRNFIIAQVQSLSVCAAR